MPVSKIWMCTPHYRPLHEKLEMNFYFLTLYFLAMKVGSLAQLSFAQVDDACCSTDSFCKKFGRTHYE